MRLMAGSVAEVRFGTSVRTLNARTVQFTFVFSSGFKDSQKSLNALRTCLNPEGKEVLRQQSNSETRGLEIFVDGISCPKMKDTCKRSLGV